MRVLLLDNYDSFTYNLAHQLRELGVDHDVIRNDKISLEDIDQFDKIILSPGPGIPKDAGIMPELVRTYASTKSIFGVCLGHQCIAENFGAQLALLPKVYHGISSNIEIVAQDYIFADAPSRMDVGRYHSWVVDPNTIPPALEITSKSDDGTIMALKHQTYDVRGVQFHPESILSEFGLTLIRNFVNGPNGLGAQSSSNAN